jgi:hypothetical protein
MAGLLAATSASGRPPAEAAVGGPGARPGVLAGRRGAAAGVAASVSSGSAGSGMGSGGGGGATDRGGGGAARTDATREAGAGSAITGRAGGATSSAAGTAGGRVTASGTAGVAWVSPAGASDSGSASSGDSGTRAAASPATAGSQATARAWPGDRVEGHPAGQPQGSEQQAVEADRGGPGRQAGRGARAEAPPRPTLGRDTAGLQVRRGDARGHRRRQDPVLRTPRMIVARRRMSARGRRASRAEPEGDGAGTGVGEGHPIPTPCRRAQPRRESDGFLRWTRPSGA